MKKILFTCLFAWMLTDTVVSQLIPGPEVNPQLISKHWDASWVAVPGASAYDYGVYFFSNTFQLKEVPQEFIIHVSADNRYKIHVNGIWIGLGPARSDADNWIYETYDISAYLAEGTNVLAAEVWNFGRYKPWAQVSLFTGLIVQGNDEAASILNTPGNWRCYQSEAHSPHEVDSNTPGSFSIVGPGDRVDGTSYPWGWKTAGYDHSDWRKPVPVFTGAPRGVGTHITHALVPRSIPAMERTPIDGPVPRRQDNQLLQSYGKKPLSEHTVPANTHRTLLLDQGELVTAYPELILSGGANASVTLTYAEALYDDQGRKQHRDMVQGLSIRGLTDEVISDGMENRKYTTLWFRTFRYIQLEITTQEEPLTIQTLTPVFTAYPFKEKAWFESDRQELASIWEAGWRTSRLCANELYFDCPYYEQMQYVGDTRIQALVSLYVSGDDRLMRKAISDFYHSMLPEGLTQGRYPSEPRQVIPTYSLFWVSMIHDYLWHRNDYYFAAQYLVSVQHILQWFENRIDATTGMLGEMPYWPFVDWTGAWPWDSAKRTGGVPPGGHEGHSALITLQYAMTLDQAADIFSFFGFDALAAEYTGMADGLVEAAKKHCWDEERGLFADTPAKKSFSQHTNAFAVLTNAVSKPDQALFMEQVTRDTTLVQASLYFRYYVNRAAIQAGLGNKYLSMLAPWHSMLEQGLTTLAEVPDTERTRSDCHAWSSSPLYELLATVAGIQPAGPGFESVIIAPHPGSLKWIRAGMPHYYGEIGLDLAFDKDGSVRGTVEVPPGLKGVFVWDHQTVDLQPGKQRVAIQSMGSKFKIDPQ
jgi:hypothetical protein